MYSLRPLYQAKPTAQRLYIGRIIQRPYELLNRVIVAVVAVVVVDLVVVI